MGIQVRPETREEFEKRCAETPADRLVGSAMIVTCDADHCTPEERAVIEAAVRDHESETHPEGESRNVGFDRMVQARREFRLAVTELLAARARKGEVE